MGREAGEAYYVCLITLQSGSAKRKHPKTTIQDIREKKKLEKEWRERQLQRKREQYEESKKKETGENQAATPSRGIVENDKPPVAQRSERYFQFMVSLRCCSHCRIAMGAVPLLW